MESGEIGRRGEELACRYLRQREGMKILYRNFKPAYGGEVDIVCRDGDALVFVEVKTRTSRAFGRPADAVDEEKEYRVARGGLEWLRMLDAPGILFRFDILEVTLLEGEVPEIELVREAFYLPDGYAPPE